MTRNRFASTSTTQQNKCAGFRNLAAHHAIGFEPNSAPEQRRLLELALTEAEALACETGVPELVLLALAEEKVRNTREWFVRQAAVKNRSYLWPIAA